MQLSLCIATMDRWDKFLSNYLPKYLMNPYIGEIIISDENGNDAKKIRENITDSRVKVFVNESRLGAFLNKRVAVSHATLPWICLMDSDNFADIEYFEAWKKVFNPENLTIIYQPSYSYPHENHKGWDYRPSLAVGIFNIANIKQELNNFLAGGCGNYIFHKDIFLKAESPANTDLDKRCYGLDVYYQNYLLIKAGASIMMVEGMHYHHIVHPGSYYINTESMVPSDEIRQLYLSF